MYSLLIALGSCSFVVIADAGMERFEESVRLDTLCDARVENAN